MIPYTVDQAGWGSSKTYADGALTGGWEPQYVIVHWGGLTSERSTDALAFDTLRGWQRYHLSKGWQDIAYNYAVTEQGSICRLRGENHGGHTSGTDPVTGKSWSTVGVGIVWVGGQADADGPSGAAVDAMRRCVDAAGLPVIGHQDVKATACPGPDWLSWAHGYQPDGEEPMYPIFGGRDDPARRQFYIEQWQLVLAGLAGHPYAGGTTKTVIAAAGMTRGVYDAGMQTLVARFTDTNGAGIGPREAAQLTPSGGTHTHPVVVDTPGTRVTTNTGGNE